MSKEIIIEHNEINNPQTITQVMGDKFKANDLDIHKHEVEVLEDDNKKGIRRLRIKNSKFFSVGEIPWHKKLPTGVKSHRQ